MSTRRKIERAGHRATVEVAEFDPRTGAKIGTRRVETEHRVVIAALRQMPDYAGVPTLSEDQRKAKNAAKRRRRRECRPS